MVGDAAGDLLLLWNTGSGIYMRRFDTQGNKLSPTVEVPGNGGVYQYQVDDEYQAAASPSGNVMVAWEAKQQAYVQLYNAQLQPLGPAVPIGGPGTSAVNVAADGLGNFDVALGTGNTIEFARFNNLGQPLANTQGSTGPTVIASAPTMGQIGWPQVAADRSGNFTIVWTSGGVNAEDFGQRYDPIGRPLGGVFLVPIGNGLPSLTADPAGDMLATDANALPAGNVLGEQWYWPTATVHVPAAQATSVGTTLVFSTAHGNAITLTGGDPTQVETLTLQANIAGPTMTVTQTAGLASITGNGTASVTLTGTRAVLNAALQGLTVQAMAPAPNLTLQVSLAPNSTMTVSGSVPITVHIVPPQVVTPLGAADETAYANVLYYESQSYFTDAAGNALTYTATLANGSPLPSWLNLDSSGRLFGVPVPGVVGTTYQVRVTATDPYGATAVLTLPIMIAPDPSQPNGSGFTVAPVAYGGFPAATSEWVNRQATAVNAAGDAMIVCGMIPGNGVQMIMGQVYNAQHQPVGPVFVVNNSEGGPGTLPTVTADAAGDFDVTWQGSSHTYLQRFSPLGVALGPVVTLAAEQGLEVVADAAGDLILLWTSQSAIYMRRFDTAGNALSPTVLVADDGTGYQAAASPSGNVLVLWQTNQQVNLQVFRRSSSQSARPQSLA